ncbi:hypothetical protein D3C84_859040 [compost metagenome]
MGVGAVTHMQKVQLGVALAGKVGRGFDHGFVEIVVRVLGVGRVDGGNDNAWQRAMHVGYQVHRARAFAQQLPVQRRDHQALEQRFVLYILDQQVGVDLGDLGQGRLKHVSGQDHFGTDANAVFMQQGRLIGQPLAVVQHQGVEVVFVAAHQAEGVDLVDKGADMQGGTRGAGQGGGTFQCRCVAQVAADHQE